jgi:heme O synthase-like polyprenyltransferase
VEHATATGKTVSSAADEAINEWMDFHGDPVLDRMRKRDKKERTGQLLPFRAERKM